jgi:HEAT repeat protein
VKQRIGSFLLGAGAILAAWMLLLCAEHLAVGFGYRALFAGTWEMGAARKFVTPIVLAMLLPAALLAKAVALLADASVENRRARLALGGLGLAFAAAVALGVSTGRHMQSIPVRGAFVAALGALGFAGVSWLGPRAAQARPRVLAAAGILTAALCWLADALVLPRLYPAFHLGLLVLTLGASALLAVAFGRRVGAVALGIAVLGAAAVPWGARRLRTVDNLRLVLLDHAPLMGPAVSLAAAVAPPEEEAASVAAVTALSAGEIPRVLDWSQNDIIVLSVDALRADHLGAYGYGRATTPNIDRLAESGTVFDYAYCPTPHTSYSVTSMMTGKYMRPLLSVGLGEDSETWAHLLRHYGRRTAAFYPPAVFFIDGPRFTNFERSGLDFEYRRVEFSSAAERAEQVSRYLDKAPNDKSLFLWVHLFEPHEPYVMHPEHPFGDAAKGTTDRDAYDSEVAAADAGIGKILERVREKRPRAIVMVTADHGEEFGEHGGRYHGTTVYEEQVRVPLVVAGPGIARRRVAAPVQTIDLLPTTLSALGIPRPARLRGRDLGPLLAGTRSDDPGLAFVETDDMTMMARGPHRLVCARRAAACALYDAKADPGEVSDLGSSGQSGKELRQLTAAVSREHGRLERGDAQGWPDALRRGMQGDADAAEEVASLLDDVRADVRRKAAEVLFDLHAPSTSASLRRALASADDADVRRASALALVRIGEAPSPLAEELLREGPPEWKRRAALAFAERGDARGGPELVAWWTAGATADFGRAREIASALAKVKEKSAVPALIKSLDDLRLRPYVADALGAIGDGRARAPLAAALAGERYVPTRPHLARALVALGGREELRAPLARFAGLPEPMLEALPLARDAKLLESAHGGWAGEGKTVKIALTAPRGDALRLLVLTEPGASLRGTAGQTPLATPAGSDEKGEFSTKWFELGARAATSPLEVSLEASSNVRAIWLVARQDELEPPPPEPWVAPSTDVDPLPPGQ